MDIAAVKQGTVPRFIFGVSALVLLNPYRHMRAVFAITDVLKPAVIQHITQQISIILLILP